MSERMSGPEAASYYDKLQKDRAASLPVERITEVLESVLATGASLRRLIEGGATAREPAAPSGPRHAAAEAPADRWCEHGVPRNRVYCPPCGPEDETPASGTSPLVTRVLTALMDMPDAEFLVLANKVIHRYHAAVAALAPPGMVPHPIPEMGVMCIHCHKIQTHRVCAECFQRHGPAPRDDE